MADDEPMEEAAVQINTDGADDSSEGGGSSDESDSDDMDIPPDQLETLMALESELEANINLYDKHLEYINLLRQLKLKVKLRAAHEQMASKFPLAEQLWLDWVNDELEQVKSAEDIEFIKSLFQRSADDYLSVELWAQYLEFLSELDADVRGATPAGIKLMRDTCEAALTAAGTHVTGGGRLWAVYRQFELGLAAEPPAGVEPDKQAERVRSLYQRQLHLPLVGNDQVMEEYKTWEAGRNKEVPAAVIKAADKAADGLSLRASYEEAIAPGKEADAALLAAYMAYIKLEQSHGDPGRVQVVYERAVSAFPLTVELWAQYCRYLDAHLSIPRLTAKVAARATRNCYWSGSLWATAIRAADRSGAAGEEITRLTAEALTAGMQSQEEYVEVLLAKLDALRRRVPAAPAGGAGGVSDEGGVLRQAFREAAQLLHDFFPADLDRSLRLPSYWSHCELHVLGDLPAARAVWEECLKSGLAKYTEVWSAAAGMERGQRHLREARALYKRAYSRKFEEGGQYYMCLEWLRFEREEGSAEDYAQALAKVSPILDEIAASAAAAAADEHTTAAAKAAAKALSPEEMRRMRQAHDPNYQQRTAAGKGRGKDKATNKSDGAFKAPAPKAATTANMWFGQLLPAQYAEQASAGHLQQLDPNVLMAAGVGQAGKRQLDDDEGPAASKRARVHEPDMQSAAQAADHSMDTEQPAEQHDGDVAMQGSMPTSDELTVFVRGLPYNTSEQQLKQFFNSCGRINNIRIPRHQNGERRNFAYVDFCTEEGLRQAVALDGSSMPGSDAPLMIAKSNRSNLGGGGGRGRGGRGWGGGGGGFGGRGRGRGYEGDGHQHFQGGRGGGAGRGRASLGLGHPGRGGEQHPRQHLQLDSGEGSSAAVHAGGPPGQPMSNSDFRAMLLSGKKG